MTRKLASAVFLVVGIVIGLGAYGHGFVGRLAIDAELDKFPIARDQYTMLYVVWYFLSGCMLLFGITVVGSWVRLRRGDRSLVGVSQLIGALYLLSGVSGMIYRHGDPFMSLFIVLGALLLASTWISTRGAPVTSAR